VGLADELHMERFTIARTDKGGEGGTVTFALSDKSIELDGATSLLEGGDGARSGQLDAPAQARAGQLVAAGDHVEGPQRATGLVGQAAHDGTAGGAVAPLGDGVVDEVHGPHITATVMDSQYRFGHLLDW